MQPPRLWIKILALVLAIAFDILLMGVLFSFAFQLDLPASAARGAGRLVGYIAALTIVPAGFVLYRVLAWRLESLLRR